jgi:hypothetical protein
LQRQTSQSLKHPLQQLLLQQQGRRCQAMLALVQSLDEQHITPAVRQQGQAAQ